MDVRHLQLLRELADHKSVTAVASATHRTASAVSQQLRTAERLAGMQLVEPYGRGIRLTDAGRVLADCAIDVETAIAKAQARWDAYRNDPGGTVSVAAFPSAATMFLPRLMNASSMTGIQLQIADHDAAEGEFAELTKMYDIVIAHSLNAPTMTRTQELVIRPLAVEPLDIAMASAHPLAGRANLHARDVAQASWIGVPEGYPFDSILKAIAEHTGKPLNVAQRLRDNRLIEALVTTSDCLAVLPRFTTPTNSQLSLIPIVDIPARRYLTALMRPDRAERRAVKTIFNLLADIASDVARD